MNPWFQHVRPNSFRNSQYSSMCDVLRVSLVPNLVSKIVEVISLSLHIILTLTRARIADSKLPSASVTKHVSELYEAWIIVHWPNPLCFSMEWYILQVMMKRTCKVYNRCFNSNTRLSCVVFKARFCHVFKNPVVTWLQEKHVKCAIYCTLRK